MNQRINNQSGFTLVEIMIGLMLTLVLMSAVFGLLSSSVMSWTQGAAHNDLEQSARIAVDSMVRELRYARAVTSVTSGSIAFVNSGGDNVAFRLGTSTNRNMNTLHRLNNPMTENNVSSLTFEQIGSRTVKISLTMHDAPTGQTKTLRTAVTCMNVPD